MTKVMRVLEWMKEHGSITSKEAIDNLGDTRLSGKIFTLKEKGYPIYSTTEQGEDRFGTKTHWSRYFLADGALERRIDRLDDDLRIYADESEYR